MIVYDCKGNEVTVGARVTDDGWSPGGTVTDITDADVDVRDDGTPFQVGPLVVVQYDDGVTERWPTSWNATGPWDDHRDDYTCEDVEVIA